MENAYGVLLTWTLSSVASLVMIFFVVWYSRPYLVLKTVSELNLYFNGMQKRRAKAGAFSLAYVERGQKVPGVPSLLFVHGFSADKGSYLPIMTSLSKNQHMVLLDLPGHGDSDTPDNSYQISLLSFAKVIKLFVEEIQLNKEPFHIIGTSLGGAITAVYAAEFPEDVAKTTLVCPAMFTPVETQFQRDVRKGKCVLLGETLADIETMLDMCVYHKYSFYRNKQVLTAVKEQQSHYRDFFQRVFDGITMKMDEEQHNFLYKWCRALKSPTQIIWGRNDQILDVSGVKLLRENLGNCVFVDILEGCGHMITFDNPKDMGKSLQKFISYTKSA